MTLAPGTRLGPYEILAPLGAGGMGEVFRATDSKLRREVAIKVLPAGFSDDPQRLARFEREAQVLASLNHPNIAAIYGLEEGQGTRALVMELVEGDDLSALIARGPLPIAEALPLARQIADALEAAHEQGIVHRDLKPANVKVRADGTVKVLDFGLAKAMDMAGGSAADPANSPTLTARATQMGMILGTVAYMAPEQARGKPVDRRSDIWAFGVVLYEMLTGRRLFSGEETSDVFAAVLRQEIDLGALTETPARIRRLLSRCLDRDVKHRLRDIGEARVAIEEELAGPGGDRFQSARDVAIDLQRVASSAVASAAAPTPAVRRGREVVAWVAFALALVAGAALWLRSSNVRPQPAAVVRASIATSEGVTFATGGQNAHGPAAISPDGRFLVFPASSKDRGIQLWIRPLDAVAARSLPGTEQAMYPFWSPDSRSIGFFAGGKLKTVAVTGGEPLVLCNAPNGRGGAWSRDGTILYAPTILSGLCRVPGAGGATQAVTHLDASKSQGTHRFPSFLPDGRHFLYYASGLDPIRMLFEGPWDGVYLGSLDGGADRFLARSDSEGQYASSHLLFMRRTTLFAVPFDPRSLAISGEPGVIAEDAESDISRGKGGFTVSEGGTLAYHPGTQTNWTQLAWLDRSGRRLGSVGEPGIMGEPELSPDGKHTAVSVLDASSGTVQIWLYDLAGGTGSRFTLGSSANRFPIWSPDGSRVYFSSNRKGSGDLYVKSASGAGDEEQVFHSDGWVWPSGCSRDGRFLAFTHYGPQSETDIRLLPLAGDKKSVVFTSEKTKEPVARISPDSRWIAYESEESGRGEIHVASFPEPGGKWQVSTGGGAYARWRRDGKELYFVSSEEEMMAVDVRVGTSFEFGKPRLLFKLPPIPNTNYWYYDVAPDGNRFLVTYPVETTQAPLSLVLNWTEALRK
jgi:Tol biopolymer transport system component